MSTNATSEVSRDRAGTLELQLVKKRKRRLDGVNEVPVSRLAQWYDVVP